MKETLIEYAGMLSLEEVLVVFIETEQLGTSLLQGSLDVSLIGVRLGGHAEQEIDFPTNTSCHSNINFLKNESIAGMDTRVFLLWLFHLFRQLAEMQARNFVLPLSPTCASSPRLGKYIGKFAQNQRQVLLHGQCISKNQTFNSLMTLSCHPLPSK
jgi:hypothetical protein